MLQGNATWKSLALGLILAIMWCRPASAERWLKIDPNDPFSSDGEFHWFDVDSAYEDPATGWIYDWGTYKPASAIDTGVAQDGFLWAFDCERDQVHYVASRQNATVTETVGWREKSDDLGKPVMGGVTNLFARKLCALKGSWPKRALLP